jgi:YihY family inner membrane protein
VNAIERFFESVDDVQRRHPVLAFPYAVVKKFGDDQAGQLAGLIAYYGFFSLFPLLLVFVSILGFVLAGDPELRQHIVNSALGEFPIIGGSLADKSGVHGLRGSGVSIAIGLATALWAGLGVAQAAQNAMNTVWDVPRSKWPNFWFRRVRALAMVVLLGAFVIASSLLSGYGTSGVPSSVVMVGTYVLAVLINFALFLLAFQLLTAVKLRWGDLVPGAICAAVGWTVLQALGGYYVSHELRAASNVYGTFALVIALLVWIYLGAQLTLMCAEINVVRQQHLWPRRLVQPPINDGDERVSSAVAKHDDGAAAAYRSGTQLPPRGDSSRPGQLTTRG